MDEDEQRRLSARLKEIDLELRTTFGKNVDARAFSVVANFRALELDEERAQILRELEQDDSTWREERRSSALGVTVLIVASVVVIVAVVYWLPLP